MPVEVYCIECGLYFYGWTRASAFSQFYDHVNESHPHKSRNVHRTVSKQRYWFHRKWMHNPVYIDVMRNSKHIAVG